MASTSQTFHGSCKVKVTILASEWGSSKEELSTMNRELAIQLAKCPEVEITVFLPQCSQKDKKEALKYKVKIMEATPMPGFEQLDWLCFPPEDLQVDIVVGHGVKLGKQAQVFKIFRKCKWVQMVHTDPEELRMFKSYSNLNSKGEEKDKTEVELCKMADHIVGIGPKLSEAFRSYLRGCQKDDHVLDFTPGVFDEFETVSQVPSERQQRSVLVFGRGDVEDFELKGFDIARRAIAALKDTRLVFVGAPEGKHEEIAQPLNRYGVPLNRLRVRGLVEDREGLKRLFQEVDLVVMPSRTEGFGLTGLEALSAGLPVVVSNNSGFGEALSSVPFGSSFVVNSEEPADWTAAIQKLWDKDRKSRLDELKALRDLYGRKYNWGEQMKELVKTMICLTHDDSLKVLSSLGKKRKASQGIEDMTEDHAGQSASSIHKKFVSADIEDTDSKAEYKVQTVEALHAAASYGNIEIIELLLSRGFEVDSRDREGVTPLMCAALNDKPGAFHILIQKGADPSLKDNNGCSLLHFAAQGGNISVINKLLSLGLDINSGDSDGATPLMFASVYGKQSTFQLLIKNGADLFLQYNNGLALLHAAAKNGNTSIIYKLLSRGLDVDSRTNSGVTPLMNTASYDNESAFQMLIENGADSSLKCMFGGSVLHSAAKGGNTSIINKLSSLGLDIDSRKNDGVTPLTIAAENGKQAAFQMLIHNGADPFLKDNYGSNLLHSAAVGGNTSIITNMISLGLDIDSRNDGGGTPLMYAAYGEQISFKILIQNGADPSLKGNNGFSLLHFAAKGGNTPIINELLSLGLDVDSRSNAGATPLVAAAFCDKQSVLEMLIQNGADPSLKDNDGNSLLHVAAQGGNTSIIKKLISLGLDIDSKDLSGKTPVIIAIDENNSEAAKFLISKGALL